MFVVDQARGQDFVRGANSEGGAPSRRRLVGSGGEERSATLYDFSTKITLFMYI